ncbi:BZ3500_MvSof-1268-A1-R1_Chr1-3g01798 [Microbotryum saponariae]|uniref:BZ3500_MvSof-1268-A1-R1_Chr1-3g01798 protein n=1 Tax=Microbotryum saponariae TaxID=289078 RepID=A0A2X0KCR7_9BASI|nr:BZ3500_MvSof-1268-A1-R1_Chr1-3g01798 [Microbotryum saponariae]SCZ94602.1 BZ3501_MvSof-1269-A2-R1_Chr1-3g01400 [Microbotryum saponariae]
MRNWSSLATVNAQQQAPTSQEWLAKLKATRLEAAQATQFELNKSYDQAFSLYLSSAQSYLYLIRHCSDPLQKEQLRNINRGVLERATRLKQSGQLRTRTCGTGNGNGNGNGNGLGTAAKGKRKREGKRNERLGLEEQDLVLERSSNFNQKRFERWGDAPAPAPAPSPAPSSQVPTAPVPGSRTENLFPPRPSQLNRSRSLPIAQPSLVSASTSYKRPSPTAPVIVPERLSALDIVQDNIGDCSLVSALIICAQHAATFGTKLGLDCLYPKDAQGWPCKSADGVYEAKFWLNGLWRRVVFDDQLPHSTLTSEPRFATTTHRDQLWPALIEKAYMTLMGTYDFAGSNSGIDVHALTGWIPEHISLNSNFRSEKTWQRLVKGWKAGTCVLTLGTGKSPREGWESRHSYAVTVSASLTGLTETKEGHRHVRFVNPWRAAMWTRDLSVAMPETEKDHPREPTEVDWDTIANSFEAIHVNWDPKGFEHTSMVHCSIPGPSTKLANEPLSPRSTRLRLRLASSPTVPAEVWILLSRHRSIANDRNEFIGLHAVKSLAGGGGHGRTEEPNVSGGRDGSPPGQTIADLLPSAQTDYTDNPFLLYRLLVDPSTLCYELFVSHRASSLDDTRFTLGAFAQFPVSIEEGPLPLAFSESVNWSSSSAGVWLGGGGAHHPILAQIESQWTSKTAGGNHTCPTFYTNPQYSIRLVAPPNKPSARAVLSLTAETSKDVSINVKLVRNRGERADRLEERDVVAGSSTYTYGIGSLRHEDLAGALNDTNLSACAVNTAYTVIISSFAPEALGTFKLSIQSDMSIVAEAIPAEGAGMFARVARGQWSSTEDPSGGQSIPRPHEQSWRIAAMDKTTRLIVRLQALDPPVGLSLILHPLVDEQGSLGPAIATTGVFSDAACGVVIRVLKLPANALGHVVVARTSSGRLEQPVDFKLLLYADQAVTLTPM